MKRIFFHALSLLLAAGWLSICVGCGSSAPATKPAPQKVVLKTADEPTFEVAGIHILPTATEDRTLPFIADAEAIPIAEPCLVRSTKAKQWETTNANVLRTLRQNGTKVSSSILKWLQSTMTDAIPQTELASWKAVVYEETVVIRHYPTNDVRFTEAQTCITDTVPMLTASSELVTTLFGAMGFSILSRGPMNPQTVKALKKAAQKKRIRVKAVPTYPRAKDENGKPMFKRGKPLYLAPDGTLVPKKDVPPPRKRPIYELQLTVPKGLYVAVGNMPKSRFVARKAPAGCQINLIFDDMTPRVPECLGSSEMGFGVAMGENPGDVVVKAATKDATGQANAPYDQTVMVQVGGTGFAWITPKRLEEGAVLKVDTLILNPPEKATAPEELKKFPYGR